MQPSIIFVVDDDPFIRMEAIDVLEDAGFDTLDAADASQAMTIMRERWQEVRILFTDVQMPGVMDGIDLVNEVHRCWPKVLLLVTSAGVTKASADLPAGSCFLRKPYGNSTLMEGVNEVIAKRCH